MSLMQLDPFSVPADAAPETPIDEVPAGAGFIEIPEPPGDGSLVDTAAAWGWELSRLEGLLLERPMNVILTTEDKSDTVRCIPPHTVRGQYGARPADVLVIGKQPNHEDMDYGRNFSGELGEIWKRPLDLMGVDYGDWMVTQVSWYHPPERFKFSQRFVKEWRRLLAIAIQRINPRFVLLMGTEAVKGFWALFDPKGAGKLKLKDVRGSVVRLNERTQVMSTIHPGAVLHDPSCMKELEQDLRSFAKLIKGEDACDIRTTPDEQLLEIDDAASLDLLVDRLIAEGHTRFAIDGEWGGGDWRTGKLRTIQFSWGPGRGAAVILRRQGLKPAFQPSIYSALQPLRRLLGRKGVTIVGHNARGDLLWLMQYGLDLMEQFINGGADTLLVHHLLNETADQQLEIVAAKILGTGRYDLELRKWLTENGYDKKKVGLLGYGDVPDSILHPYAIRDAIVTWMLDERLQPQLAAVPELHKLYVSCVHPLNLPILEMEMTGVHVDVPLMRQLIDLFANKQVELRQEIESTFNWPGFNPRSVDQLKELLFGMVKTKDGQPQYKAPPGATTFTLTPLKATDDTMWEKVLQDDHPEDYSPSTDGITLAALTAQEPKLEVIRKFKLIDQVCKNFLRAEEEDDDGELEWNAGLGKFVDEDHRIRTRYRTWLETGRYSTSPNLQNIPQKQEAKLAKIFKAVDGTLNPLYRPIRHIFQASPGHVLIDADWSSAELWTMGFISGDEDYIHALLESDLHTEMMRKMFFDLVYKGRKMGDYTVAELTAMLNAGDKTLKAYRTCAKVVNFGVPYQISAQAIQLNLLEEGVHQDLNTIQGWIDTFYGTFQKAAKFIQFCKDSVLTPGYLVNPWGRYRRFPSVNDKRKVAAMQREACNFPIQSTVADAMSFALLNLWNMKRFVDTSLQYRLVLSVHDAVVLEVPCQHVGPVIERALPVCMSHGLEVPKIGLKYRLGEIVPSFRWNEVSAPESLEAAGVPRQYCGYPASA
jgi:uracil-DNA glycosylase family 4